MDPQTDPAKDRLISYALERFLAEGFANIPVELIASELGISKKTFYKHFRNKEDLVASAIEHLLAQVRARLVNVTTADVPFIQKLHSIMEILGVQVSKFGRRFQDDVQRFSPTTWKRIEAFRRDAIHTNIGPLMQQGVREGSIRQDVNLRIFILAYVGIIDALIRPSVLADESFSAHEALMSIMGIFFHGILTQEAANDLARRQQQSPSHSL